MNAQAASVRRPARATAAHELGDFTADRRVLILMAMAVVAGAGGAAGAWVLLKLIAAVSNLVWHAELTTRTFTFAGVHASLWMLFAPAIGGLIIGLMARFGSDKIRGHGIPEAIEAILIGGSRMSPKVAVLKPISSAIAIGTGGPFGAEGPIIMTGGAVGSLFAQFFHLSAAERKTLLVAGAAAGMTGVFGTPIAAVMLAVELLLFEWKPRSFLPVLTAVFVATLLRPYLLGAAPLFPVTPVGPGGVVGLLLAVAVGLVAGLQSGLLTFLLYRAEDAFMKLKLHWMWWPAIGGLVVGAGGLIDPRALGVGYDIIGNFLHGQVAAPEAARLMLVKMAIWIVALASGTSGGVLAPLLIFGGLLGAIEAHILPGSSGYWSMLAMSAMMSGTMRAPLTGAFFAAELTGDFGAIVPLFVAGAAAYAVTVLLLKRSILTEKIARRGLHITREYSVDPFQLTRVGEVMIREVQTLPASMPVDEAVAFFTADAPRFRSYPIVDGQGRLIGMAARAEVLRWVTEGTHKGQTVAEVLSDPAVPTTHPDELVGELAERMVEADFGRAPVLDAQNRVIGLVTRKDLLRVHAQRRALEGDREAVFGLAGGRSPKLGGGFAMKPHSGA